MAHIQIFLSTVSAEFRSYRDRLRHDLTRPNVSVAVQEDFIVTGTETLDMLDDYVRQCDAVIHLVGDMTGAPAQAPSLATIRQRYPDLVARLPPLAPFLQPGAAALSYTQWEAWLALYHGKPLIIAVPEDNAPRDERYERNSEQSAAQQAHLNRLAEMERYPFCFANADRLTVEVLRSKLQEILAQAGPSVRPAPSSDSDLPKLLTLMKSAWIDGFRANSLKEIVQLELGKESYTHAIDHPLKDLMRLEDQSVQPLPPNASITEAFRMAEDFLLILGEPGSGKTITLLDLASDLIATAEANPTAPVPVVLNLSTWNESDRSFDSWIIRELKSKYYVPERLTKNWLKRSRLLLMLDGLDEVISRAREKCVLAINAFLEESNAVGMPTGMVLSCRVAEYEALPIRLRFKGAIKLLPLTIEQIDHYLSTPRLEAIRTAVQSDAQLRELARTPLVLNIMVMAYKDEKNSAVPIETGVTRNQQYKNLMDRYITKMFKRRGDESKQPYTKETVLHILSWLAQRLVVQSQTVFLIESLQPDWLSGRAAWVAYWIGTRITWAAVYGLFMMGAFLLFKLANPNAIESVGVHDVALGLILLCCVGGITGFIDARLYTNRHTAQLTSKGKRFWIRTLLYSGSYLLMIAAAMLSAPPSVAKMIASASGFLLIYVAPIASFRSLKRDTRGDIVTKSFGLAWKRAERGYVWATFSIMLLFGVQGPFIMIWEKHEPIVVGIAAFCTALAVLFWPYFGYYARQDTENPISFLSRIGMTNYLSATGRLAIFFLAVGLVTIITHTLLNGWPKLGIAQVGGAFLSFIGISLYLGLITASFSAIKPNTIESTSVPNQGIKLTFRHAVVSSMLVFLIGIFLICGPLFMVQVLINSKDDVGIVTIYLLLFASIATTVGLWYGVAVLRHFILRFILYRQGHIPKDFVRFLNHSTNLIFLRKVGGGYVFIHRLVMEHFASLKVTPAKLSPAVETATNK